MGRQPASKVREALKKAAKRFDEELLGVCKIYEIKDIEEYCDMLKAAGGCEPD